MSIPVGTLALLAFALLAIGYLVFLILGSIQKFSPIIKDVWPILHVETLIIAVIAGALWIGGWVLTAVLIAHAFRVAWEAANVATKRATLTPPLIYAANTVFISVIAVLFAPLWLVAVICLAVTGGCFFLRGLTQNERGKVALDLTMFPGAPLILFTSAGITGGYEAWLLLAFMMVEVFDSYALLGGKLFGRRKAFPILSPKKTVEGLGVGLAMLIVTAFLIAQIFGQSPASAVLLAVSAAVLDVLGDLAASRLKRLSRVKDYPQVLPHQGGLFDTTDAWIATGSGMILIALFTGSP